MRRIAEQQLRLQRTMDDLAGDFPKPTPEEVLEFYRSIKDRFASSKSCWSMTGSVGVGSAKMGLARPVGFRFIN